MTKRIFVLLFTILIVSHVFGQKYSVLDSLRNMAMLTENNTLKKSLYFQLSKEYFKVDSFLGKYFSQPIENILENEYQLRNKIAFAKLSGANSSVHSKMPQDYLRIIDSLETQNTESLKEIDKIDLTNHLSLNYRACFDYINSYLYAKEAITLCKKYSYSNGEAEAKANLCACLHFLDPTQTRWFQYGYDAIKIYLDNNKKENALQTFYEITELEVNKFQNGWSNIIKYSDATISDNKNRIKYCESASALFESTKDSVLLFKVYDAMSYAPERIGDYNLCLKYLLKQSTLLRALRNSDFSYEKYESRKAYLYAQNEVKSKSGKIDLLHNDLKIKQLLLYKEKLEADKKEDAITLLNQEKEIQDLQLSQKNQELIKQKYFALENSKKTDSLKSLNNIQIIKVKQQTKLKNVFVAGFSILAVLIIILFYSFRQRQKVNKNLSNTLSNLKETQDQLVHKEKMASLGELTSGIAHEIQNPLNFVINYSALSLDYITEAKAAKSKEEQVEILNELKQNLEKVNFHGNRTQNVVKSMLLFSRSGKLAMQEVNLLQIAEEILSISYQSFQSKHLGFKCEIKKVYNVSELTINVIPQDFSRMFFNLFNNSYYALWEKSKNSVSEYNPVLTITVNVDAQKIYIKLHDNGIGISETIINKIYNPFFTTKPPGEGTGLGLGISYDIAKAHRGNLRVNSKENEFTEFEISLIKSKNIFS